MTNRHVYLPAALVVLQFILGPTAQADEPATESALPAPIPHDAIEDVVYGHKDGLALTLDVLTPRAQAKGIGVLLISSGSWRSSKPDVLDQELVRRDREHWVQGLLQGGYTLFVVRHGSAPRYFVPEMIEDVRRAVRFVRHEAPRFAVDPQRLGITSGSSGGHLSLMVGLTGDDGRADAEDPIERASSRTQAVVAWFPPTDLINWGRPEGYKTIEVLRKNFFQQIFGEVTDLPEQLRTISPIAQVSADDPPVLLIHGDRDATVPLQQSQVLAERYQAEKLPVELIVQPGGGHTYWPGILEKYPAVWAWLDRYLKPLPD